MDTFKSKNGASVSEEFILFSRSSVGYIWPTICSKKGLSIFSKSSKHLEVELKASIMSVCLLSDRDNMKSLSQQNKNKSATRGAQLVPIGILTICLYYFAPNLIYILSKSLWRATHIFWHDHSLYRLGCSEVKMHSFHYKPNKVSPLC